MEIAIAFLEITIVLLFSHPDFTVGQGITPCRERDNACSRFFKLASYSLLFADYTAGMEFHHSPKIYILKYVDMRIIITRILINIFAVFSLF